jgi:hypothetical protein
MRFDHTHEQDRGGRTSTARSADTPSVDRAGGRLSVARGMWVRLADSSAPAKQRATDLATTARAQATAARDLAVAALAAVRAWNADRPVPLRAQDALAAVRRWNAARPLHLRVRDVLAEGGASRLALALGVIACLGLAAVIGSGGAGGGTGAPIDPVAARPHGAAADIEDAQADRIGAADEASRAERPAAPRAAPPAPAAPAPAAPAPAAPAPAAPVPAAPAPAAPAAAAPAPAAPAAPAAKPRPKRAAKPKPVAGLSRVQMDNAHAIVRTGQKMGLPKRAMVIAVATAMQESELLNRASEVLPESKRYKHQGTGWDHDSVGLFQQRTSTGWGPVKDLMNPEYASRAFYEVLVGIPGWNKMRLTQAAQAVQVSAYPDHYAKHESRATAVVDALTR